MLNLAPAASPLTANCAVLGVPARAELSPARAARRADLMRSLTELALVPEDAYSLEYWQLGTFNAFKPRNAWEDWLTQMASVMMFRISRAERIERRLRDMQALRAIDFWEEDQQLAAEEVAARLIQNPGRTVANLKTTPAGCDWLIARWTALGAVPVEQWTEAQKVNACLLDSGTGREWLRPGAVAERIASLTSIRERTLDADRSLRALVEADVSESASKPLARLRRYRADLQRQLRWYVDQLHVEPPEHRLDHRYRPGYERRFAEPAAPPAPDASDIVAPVASAASPVPAAPPSDEANPPANLAEPQVAETKPLAEPAGPFVEPQTEARSGFGSLGGANEAARVAERQRRIDPTREVARQRQAARRHSA